MLRFQSFFPSIVKKSLFSSYKLFSSISTEYLEFIKNNNKCIPFSDLKNKMPESTAADIIKDFLKIDDLKPGQCIKLDTNSILKILYATTNGSRLLDGGKHMHAENQNPNMELEQAIFKHADSVTNRFFSNKIGYRGLIEFSNICQNDCYYCGIRKFQPNLSRYVMSYEEIIDSARFAFENGYGSVMLQSGELLTTERYQFLLRIVRDIIRVTQEMDKDKKGVCVALSTGELSKEMLQELYDNGAQRYLLRIETSNPSLFQHLHPQSQTFSNRLSTLYLLKNIGYQIGTGIMVGIPGQTLLDLSNDLEFFRKLELDMIGMGPYIYQQDTPIGDEWHQLYQTKNKTKDTIDLHFSEMFQLTTRLYALSRIIFGNINISATTALQAINPQGREMALLRGANIIMPILTPTQYRESYQLYEGKPCVNDTRVQCRDCLKQRFDSVERGSRYFLIYPLNYSIYRLQISIFKISSSSSKLTKCTIDYLIHLISHLSSLKNFNHLSGILPLVILKLGPVFKSSDPFLSRKYHYRSFSSSPSPKLNTTNLSYQEHSNIGIFGNMNVGKSTLLNILTKSNISIVDDTPGTTSDIKETFMEFHDIGKTRLFDTAGGDEKGILGDKKRHKAFDTLKKCNIAILVVDPAQFNNVEYNLTNDILINNIQKIISSHPLDLLPTPIPSKYLKKDGMVILNIPMDLETPKDRLLRPQNMVLMNALNHYMNIMVFRMDLDKARSSHSDEEKLRFQEFLSISSQYSPRLLITDSQAIDIVHPWTIDSNKSLVDITTFSVSMINRTSNGQLNLFLQGIEKFKNLKENSHILICESCNHNRITSHCNDISTGQIPNLIKRYHQFPLHFHHSFGRDLPDLVSNHSYDLAIHCGGCMLDSQTIQSRLFDLTQQYHIPTTNFGLLLSFLTSSQALSRCLVPWDIKLN